MALYGRAGIGKEAGSRQQAAGSGQVDCLGLNDRPRLVCLLMPLDVSLLSSLLNKLLFVVGINISQLLQPRWRY